MNTFLNQQDPISQESLAQLLEFALALKAVHTRLTLEGYEFDKQGKVIKTPYETKKTRATRSRKSDSAR